jgi:hypothetical protein
MGVRAEGEAKEEKAETVGREANSKKLLAVVLTQGSLQSICRMETLVRVVRVVQVVPVVMLERLNYYIAIIQYSQQIRYHLFI